MQRITQPLTLFLIGATGDLAKKKILKAIYRLHEQNLLPEKFTLIGNARKEMSNQAFGEYIKQLVKPNQEEVWQTFASNAFYVAGDATARETFEKISTLNKELEGEDRCGNHMWYLSTLPQLYLPIIKHLKETKLCTSGFGWSKILIEKPFGTNLETAQELNKELEAVFAEEDIYRLDHYLGKETVQNVLAFRFANGLFEHLWNAQYVDHIQISYGETLGVEGRAEFYDSTGAVRDVVQNHVLQMIAMTLMEEPKSFSASDIRQARSELLGHLNCIPSLQDEESVLFGQYTAGEIDGQKVVGYLEETGVPKGSETETATALKIGIDNDRWRGVPIYVRTGKRFARTVLEISIQFKEPKNTIFKDFAFGTDPNVLTLRFQPNEGIVLRLYVKKPGLNMQLDSVPMEFCYRNMYQMDFVEAYEKLIYDATTGDPTLFPTASGIESAWRIIDSMLTLKETAQPIPYPAGSWGPKEFDELIKRDGREWIEPSVDFCKI